MKILQMLAVAGAMTFSALPAAAQAVGIAAGQQGSQNYRAGGLLAKVLTDKAQFNARLQSYGGPGAYMPLMNSGDIDFAPIVVPDVYEAVVGIGPFQGKPQKNLRVLNVVGPTRVGMFVRKDSAIRSIADLKGKRVTYGYTAQGTLVNQVKGILANGGLSEKDITPVMVPSVPRGVDEFMAGNADAAFFALRGGKVNEADASVGGIRFLPLSNEPGAVAAMQKEQPGSYVIVEPPAEGQPGITAPLPVMAYDYLFMTAAHVSDDVVYKATKAIAENDSMVAKETNLFPDFKKSLMVKNLGELKYHPGAIKYYKEAGLWPAGM